MADAPEQTHLGGVGKKSCVFFLVIELLNDATVHITCEGLSLFYGSRLLSANQRHFRGQVLSDML